MTLFFAQDNTTTTEIDDAEYRLGFGNCNNGALSLIASRFNSVLNRISRSLIPSGGIILFNGKLSGSEIIDIPEGWLICDGLNGTPDLGDRVVMGHGTSYHIGVTGGRVTQTVAAPTTANTIEVAAGTGATVASSDHTHTSSTLQPFYTLAYIMKA